MSTLVDVYTASDTSIIITDYKVKVNVSADSDNMLATTANGLYVDGSGKVDKVVGTVGNFVTFAANGAVSDTGIASSNVITKLSGATENNLATYTADGGISDTGIAIATNAEVTEMLDTIFGSILKSVSFASTSDFFSTNAATFHTFLQSAYDALEGEDKDELTAINFEVVDDEENGGSATISYGDIATLLANTNADSGDFAALVNGKLEEEDVDVTMSCAANTLTFSGATDFTVTITEGQGGASGVGHIILQSLYNGATDKTAFSTEENNDDAEPYTSYTLELQSA